MTSNWQGYTNKRLFHARLLLDSWRDADAVAKPAYRESCLNAMVMAHRSLLAEIMNNYQLLVTELPSLDEAVSALSHKDEASSELGYMEQLIQQDSWLSALLKAYQECMMPQCSQTSERMMIPLTHSGSTNMNDEESAGKVLESLKELVTYSRNFSLEW